MKRRVAERSIQNRKIRPYFGRSVNLLRLIKSVLNLPDACGNRMISVVRIPVGRFSVGSLLRCDIQGVLSLATEIFCDIAILEKYM